MRHYQRSMENSTETGVAVGANLSMINSTSLPSVRPGGYPSMVNFSSVGAIDPERNLSTVNFASIAAVDTRGNVSSKHLVSMQLFYFANYQSEGIIPLSLAIISLVVGIFGWIGNITAFLIIRTNKRFHNSTFTAIAALALAAFFCLTFHFLRFFTTLEPFLYSETRNNFLCIFCLTVVLHLFNILKRCIYISYQLHLAYLVVLRFGITFDPLQTRLHVTRGLVVCCCGAIWIYSFLVGAAIYYMEIKLYYDQDTLTVRSFAFDFGVIGVSLLSCLTLILHAVKLRVLKMSTVKSQVSTTMTLIVFVNVFLYLAFVAVTVVVIIVKRVMKEEDSIVAISLIRLQSTLTHIQFSSVPFVYFFSAFNIRKSLKCLEI